MKIKKLLPLALALMLVSPAFAIEQSKSATTDQTITIDKFIRITHVDGTTESVGAIFNAEYNQITLTDNMVTTFHVVTNNPDEKIKLTGTCKADTDGINALYGEDATTLKLVFTNNGTGTRAAKDTAVTDITGGSAKIAQNPNAIAFALVPSIVPDKASGAGDTTPTPTKEDDGVKYTLQNGIYDFTYTLQTTAETGTFSTHDTDGTYKATLKLTQVGA